MKAIQCTATAKGTGERCRKMAILGSNVCHKHGGAAKNVKQAAARRVAEEHVKSAAERQLRRLGEPSTTADPGQLLLRLVREKAAEVDWLRFQVDALNQDSDLWWGRVKHTEGQAPMGYVDESVYEARQNVVYQLLHKAQDQLASYASAALKAGIEERQVRVAEETAGQFSQILTRLRSSLSLSGEQAAAWDVVVGEVVRDSLTG